jgi:hypothetical protein
MDELEEKLGAILNDPQTMEKIMSIAQSLGEPSPEPGKSVPVQNTKQEPDLSILQSISGLTKTGSVTKEQQALLTALSPYLNRDRINRLERAMRAAHMAKFASAFLNAGGGQLLTGR